MGQTNFLKILIGILFISCQNNVDSNKNTIDSESSIKQKIIEKLENHTTVFEEKNIEKALTMYTSDAVIRAANMDPARGKEELKQFFTNWFGAIDVKDVTYTTEELYVFDNYALQIGNYTAIQQFPNQEEFSDRGSFTILWLKQFDGDWKYHRGIFNSSLPVNETITSKK